MAALRGTQSDLRRDPSPLRSTLRTVLFVPYLGAEIIAWPIERIVNVAERVEVVQPVID